MSNTFTLYSKTLGGVATNKEFFSSFGCTGQNISPQLYWQNPPNLTESFALTIHDETAPTLSGWWHWLVFNIPKTVFELVEDAGNINKNLLPNGAIQSITDFGVPGYGGPCPPIGHGWHKYTITIHALKVQTLEGNLNTIPAQIGFQLYTNTIEKASLIFYAQR